MRGRRVVLFGIVGIVLLLVQMNIRIPFGYPGVRPDLILGLIVALAIFAPPWSGALLCWIFGLVLECLSGIHPGMGQIYYLVVLFFIQLLKRIFQFKSPGHVFALLCLAQVLKYGYILFLFLYVYEHTFSLKTFTQTWLFETMLTLPTALLVHETMSRLYPERKEPLFSRRLMYHGRYSK